MAIPAQQESRNCNQGFRARLYSTAVSLDALLRRLERQQARAAPNVDNAVVTEHPNHHLGAL